LPVAGGFRKANQDQGSPNDARAKLMKKLSGLAVLEAAGLAKRSE
jgi:hypothetical protein